MFHRLGSCRRVPRLNALRFVRDDRFFQSFPNSERIDVAGLSLRAIHTPGHASNHLCYLFEDEKLLFTGDHIMQGSTVVINPPDGDMAAYFASLRLLLELDIAYFAPGHAFLMDDAASGDRTPAAVSAGAREQVYNAVSELGAATLAELIPRVYDDVPARMYPVAQRSLLAHLIKLQGEGACRP